MQKPLAVAVLLFTASAADARAFDLEAFCGRALSAAQSLFRPSPNDREIIAAPYDLDRKMALTAARHRPYAGDYATPLTRERHCAVGRVKRSETRHVRRQLA